MTLQPSPVEDFEDLFENAPFGYLPMSPDSRIFKANATLARWLGLTPTDLGAKRFGDLLSTPSRIVYEVQIAPILQTDAPFEEVALDLVTSAGDRLPVLVNGASWRDPATGQLVRRLALMRAPDRRHYERQILASRDAAEAESELSQERVASTQGMLLAERETAALREQFIAVLGHDLRNPLASIAGAARLLRKQPQSEKALTFIRLLEASVDRMAALIDNVLDFARGRLGGGLPLIRTRVDVEPIILQIVEELRAAHPDRRIETELGLSEPILADATRLSQLVSNLVGNAIAHGAANAPIRVGAAIEGRSYLIWVANGGEPIAERAMRHLFHPFFRGEVRASQQGLGLGLYIASEIAAAHGGALTVTSDRTETRFLFRAPID